MSAIHCENCSYWNQAEEECSISDMWEYDSDTAFRLCAEENNRDSQGDE